jgi:hypothetical protein
MEDNREEALQHQAEQHQSIGIDRDSRAYRIVFEALRKETDFQLPARFADSVMDRLQQQGTRSTNEYAWLGVGIFLFFIAAVVAVILTDFKLEWGFLKGASCLLNLFIFGAVFILALQWLDRKFIRRLTNH